MHTRSRLSSMASAFSGTAGVCVLAGFCVGAAACGRGETPAPASTQQTAPASGPQSSGTTGQVDIQFQSQPDPPQAGSNTIEVTVGQPDGSPVTDATVNAVFSMPPMPAMNMPAMRTDAPLTHAGNGVYRGAGQLSMAGTWNVTVTVSRGTEQLGAKRLSVVAK